VDEASLSLKRPRGGGLGVASPSLGTLEVEVEEKGLWKGATLFMGALLGEPGGGSFFRGPEGYERKALGMSFFLMGAQLGHMEWPHLPGTLRCG